MTSRATHASDTSASVGESVALPTSSGALPRPRLTPPSLYDYGLIGNLHTTALVSRFGSIDWACFPQFASPSVFAGLLDRDRGGSALVEAPGYRASFQGYLPATNLLQTRFEFGDGRRLFVTDFMPIDHARPSAGDPRIIRLIEAAGGTVPVRIRIAPRFRYAREAASWQPGGGHWIARGASGDELRTHLPWTPVAAEGEVRAEGELAAGERAAVELAWGPRGHDDSFEGLFVRTMTFWREWVHREHHVLHQIAAPWHPQVERSELLLKLLANAETGAFVAAPTTSLPEWPGGSRNWDYRYVWLRDAAFTAQVLALLGHHAEAQAYLRWVVHRIGAEGQLRVMYDAHGGHELAEQELPHLAGYLDSRPVRVGNGASDQTQLDIYGEVLDAALILKEVDPDLQFLREHWPALSRLADAVTSLWRVPDHGLWEIRGLPAEYVHSKLMCWVALDRAAQLGTALGNEPRVAGWRTEAEAIRAAVLARGYDRDQGAFVQAFDRPVLDAALLRVPLVGLLPYDDARVLSTIEVVRRKLGRGAFIYRYTASDGIDDPEGAFLLCSFWMVECLARSGRRPLALKHWRALLAASSPLGLFAEEYDPRHHRPLGNYPQAFTHIGLLRAALALGLTAPLSEGV